MTTPDPQVPSDQQGQQGTAGGYPSAGNPPPPHSTWGTPGPAGYGRQPGSDLPPNWGAYAMPPEPKGPIISFRPLNIGDLFEGTFAALRYNTKTMFTISVAVMAGIGIISGILNAIFAQRFDSIFDWAYNPNFWLDELEMGQVYSTFDTWALAWGSLASSILALVEVIATLLISGLLVLVVTEAIVGVRLSLEGTWAKLKPRMWRLVGVALLVWLVVFAVIVAMVLIIALSIGMALAASDQSGWISVPLGVLAVFVLAGLVLWLTIRLYFATLIVVVEDTSVTGALSRSWVLTRGAFWRILGRLLLVGIVVGITVSILSGTISWISVLLFSFAPLPVGAFITTVLTALITGLALPVSASFSSLMYVDERFRTEGLAPVLEQTWKANQASES